MNRLTLIIAFVACVSLIACNEPDGTERVTSTSDSAHAPDEHGHDEHEEEGHDEHSDAGGEIVMDAAAITEAGITVEQVITQPASASIVAPGKVIPTQYGVAHVGTIIPGRISRLFVTEGSYVAKGAALAEIESFDIGAIRGEYVAASARVEQSRAAVARQERLLTENLGAKKNLEEARSAHTQALASLRAAESKLRTVGISPNSTASGTYSSRITIRSPITGVVARRAVALGEYLEPDRDAFEIVNTGTVWIDAQVSPTVATTLAVGGVGFVRDRDDHRHTGRISFIAPTVDPETRTVTVRTEVINPNVHMRPESFVSMEFERAVSGFAISIPKSAIEHAGNDAFVYREHEPGHFERVSIELGADAGERQIASEGLHDKDRIAVSGVFYLKSARLKGELQEHKH